MLSASDTAGMKRLLDAARDARLQTEKKNSATPDILEAWRRWYAEAADSLNKLSM
jgi:hypothetical protein